MIEAQERALSLWEKIQAGLSDRRIALFNGDRQTVRQLTQDLVSWQAELNRIYLEIGASANPSTADGPAPRRKQIQDP